MFWVAAVEPDALDEPDEASDGAAPLTEAESAEESEPDVFLTDDAVRTLDVELAAAELVDADRNFPLHTTHTHRARTMAATAVTA